MIGTPLTVFLATPVNRAVLRIEYPSIKQPSTFARSVVDSWFMGFVLILAGFLLRLVVDIAAHVQIRTGMARLAVLCSIHLSYVRNFIADHRESSKKALGGLFVLNSLFRRLF